MKGYIKLTAEECPEAFVKAHPDGVNAGISVEVRLQEVNKVNKLQFMLALAERLNLKMADWITLSMIAADGGNKLSSREVITLGGALAEDPE